MMTVISVGLALLPGTVLTTGQVWAAGFPAITGALLTLAGTVVQSSGEEILFRGWLLATIGARHRPRWGIIASSVLFGLAHAINPNATLLGILNLSLFGAFLALLALAEGGLWGACAWHSFWNWTGNTLFGLPDSGGPSRQGLMMSIQPHGRDIITGGMFGPDGGLIETIVLVIGIAVVVWYGRDRNRRADRKTAIAS